MEATKTIGLHQIVFFDGTYAMQPKSGDTLATGDVFLGCADNDYDSTGASNGEIKCKIWRNGIFRFASTAISGTLVIGAKIKITNAGVMSVDATNEMLNQIGMIVGFEGADPLVDIGGNVGMRFATTLAAGDIPA